MTSKREEVIEVIVSKLDDKEDWVDVNGIADALLERFDMEYKRCCREMNDKGLCIIHSNFGRAREEGK